MDIDHPPSRYTCEGETLYTPYRMRMDALDLMMLRHRGDPPPASERWTYDGMTRRELAVPRLRDMYYTRYLFRHVMWC